MDEKKQMQVHGRTYYYYLTESDSYFNRIGDEMREKIQAYLGSKSAPTAKIIYELTLVGLTREYPKDELIIAGIVFHPPSGRYVWAEVRLSEKEFNSGVSFERVLDTTCGFVDDDIAFHAEELERTLDG